MLSPMNKEKTNYYSDLENINIERECFKELLSIKVMLDGNEFDLGFEDVSAEIISEVNSIVIRPKTNQ